MEAMPAECEMTMEIFVLVVIVTFVYVCVPTWSTLKRSSSARPTLDSASKPAKASHFRPPTMLW